MVLALITSARAGGDLTWTGVDLGLVTFVGNEAMPAKPATKKREALPSVPWPAPDELFPSMPADWNNRLGNYVVDVTADRMRTKSATNLGHLVALHESATPVFDLESTDTSAKPRLSRGEVVVRVASYPRNPLGMGLTLIADQLNTNDRQGCYWVTWFDTGSGVVHKTDYTCGRPGVVSGNPSGLWFGSAKGVLADLPEGPPPDARIRIQLTDAEQQALVAKQAADEALLAQIAATGESVAERAAADANRKKTEKQMLWSGGAGFVTIQTTAEGLSVLQQANIPYQVVGSAGLPGAQGAEAECETAFGKTACGYDCTVAFGDVKCAGRPGGKCEVAFGEITCSP